jgi:peptidoglycan hydrolase CwlO-like protein
MNACNRFTIMKKYSGIVCGIVTLLVCFAEPVMAQENDPTPDAPQEKKKTVRKAAKSAAASSEDIEALINEMAKKLKDAKEREQTERDEKKQALQEKIQKLNAEMQSLQRELGEVRGSAPAMNAARLP